MAYLTFDDGAVGDGAGVDDIVGAAVGTAVMHDPQTTEMSSSVAARTLALSPLKSP